MPDNHKNRSYLTPYQQAHDEHGAGFDVTLWANPKSQQLRFEAFTRILPMAGKKILDAGCSRGDFARYLLDNQIEFQSYTGIDGVKQVIEHARQQNLPRCAFIAGDFLAKPALLASGQPDIVTICGSLNTMTQDQAKAVLQGAWEGCEQALIFNFLSSRCGKDAPEQEYPAKRLHTLDLIDWALDKTWAVRFYQDYFANGHDATIVMYKPDKMVVNQKRTS